MNTSYLERGQPVQLVTRFALPSKAQPPALTPAPHELAHLAHVTTAGRLDETLLVRVLIGAGEAGMPWKLLLAIVHQLIQTVDGDLRNLEEQRDTWIRTHAHAANTWKTNHPNGAR